MDVQAALVLLLGQPGVPDGRHIDLVPGQNQLLAQQLHLALGAADEW
jgi:hypothetical protein